MRIKYQREKLCETRNAKQTTGLWSCHAFYSTEIIPVGKTLETMGQFLTGDIVRWETWDEMRRMVGAKGWSKTPSRKLDEYAAQYSGLGAAAPAWFRAWRRFAHWIQDLKTQDRREDRARVSFGYANYGMDCFEERIQKAHAFLLRIEGVLHIAVVLHEGAPYWRGLLHNAAVLRHYDRYALLGSGRHVVVPVDATLVDEMLNDHLLCLFRVTPDARLDAVLSEANADESLAALVRTFRFYLANPGLKVGETPRFELTWSILYNPHKRRIESVVKNRPRIQEVMSPRGRSWMRRPIPVTDLASVHEVARQVALNDGYAQLPPDAPEELVRAMTAALFHITFPDRRPEEPGGLLNGYQLPERIMYKATKPVRGDNSQGIVARRKATAATRIDARRKLVLDTLMARAVRVLSARNGLAEDEARHLVENLGGRQLLESAAWRLGMMEGTPLIQFKGGESGGNLKLPDLSLAVAFEHLAGLSGGNWREQSRLVQTARILPLSETVNRQRHSIEATFPAHRLWNGGALRGGYPPKQVRILCDNGKYYVLIVPRFGGGYKLERDLMPDPARDDAVVVPAYRCVSDGERARERMHVKRENFDINKVFALAQQGRMALYAIDFGNYRWLADAVYSERNVSPCRIVASVPQLVECEMENEGEIETGRRTSPRADEWECSFKVTFTANPQAARGNVGVKPRSWTSYRVAYPDDRRPQVQWPYDPSDTRSAREAVEEMARKDGVIVTDREHAAAALKSAGYVVLSERADTEEGGTYRGYTLLDRIFLSEKKRPCETHDPIAFSSGRQSEEIHCRSMGRGRDPISGG